VEERWGIREISAGVGGVGCDSDDRGWKVRDACAVSGWVVYSGLDIANLLVGEHVRSGRKAAEPSCLFFMDPQTKTPPTLKPVVLLSFINDFR